MIIIQTSAPKMLGLMIMTLADQTYHYHDHDPWAKKYFDPPRATVDQDGDGDISKEEFITNALNSKFVHDMLVEKSQF